MKSINIVLLKRPNVKLIFKLGISYKGMGLSLDRIGKILTAGIDRKHIYFLNAKLINSAAKSLFFLSKKIITLH